MPHELSDANELQSPVPRARGQQMVENGRADAKKPVGPSSILMQCAAAFRRLRYVAGVLTQCWHMSPPAAKEQVSFSGRPQLVSRAGRPRSPS